MECVSSDGNTSLDTNRKPGIDLSVDTKQIIFWVGMKDFYNLHYQTRKSKKTDLLHINNYTMSYTNSACGKVVDVKNGEKKHKNISVHK